MDYIELKCLITDNNEEAKNVLIAELAVLGYDTFQDTEDGINAYIPENKFVKDLYNNIYCVKNNVFGKITFSYTLFKDKNWNEYWEKNFQPVSVKGKILIRAPFHESSTDFEYEIILEPKMSFGTGHHATTWLMLAAMLDMDFTDKKVLDIGCGTGILSIFADISNAEDITGFDNNDWAYNNALENILLNQCNNVKILHGDIDTISFDSLFNVILANINRNVILDEMLKYMKYLKKDGEILFSGILSENEIEIHDLAVKNKLSLLSKSEKDNWLMLKYKKVI